MVGSRNGMYGKKPWNLGRKWEKSVRDKISKSRKRHEKTA